MASMAHRIRAAVDAGLRSGALPLLIVLLLTIPVFVTGHVAHGRSSIGFFTQDPRWSVDVDRSYIEISGYLQLAVSVALLLGMSRRWRRAPVLAAWAGALAVVVLDDSLTWHERAGEWLASRLDLPAALGLRGVDFGELLFWGALGVAVLAGLGLTHRRSSDAARGVSWQLLALIVLLACFSVGVDMVHAALMGLSIDLPLSTLEAAGEVGAMSAILAYIVHLTRAAPEAALQARAGQVELRA